MEKKELFVPETKRDPKLYLRFSDSTIRYIFHPTFSPEAYGKVLEDRPVVAWPEKTDQWCIHDGHPFEGRPIPIPLSFDPKSGRIEVAAGVCCSGPCLKTYIREQQLLTPRRLAITKLMLTEVFGVAGAIPFAPPRCMLKQHGGPLDLLEFRGAKHSINFRQSPFVTRDMIFEEVMVTDRQQQAPAVFVDDSSPVPLPRPTPHVPRKTTKKTKTATPSNTGSLVALIKKDP